MRLALIANHASGAGTRPARLAELIARHGADVELHDVDHAEAAAHAGADRIAVAGGDGSIGCAAEAALAAGVPLAVIPTGTANDFARAMDIPLDVEEACALAARPGAPTRPVDLARAAGRPFLNAASTGLSVLAARRAHDLKPKLGPLAYAVGAARAGVTADPLACRVRCDGDELFSGPAWQVIVAGTGAFGGGAELDEADPADRRLDVAVLEGGSRLALVRRAWGMRAGGLAEQPGVRHSRGRTVEVDVEGGGAFNVDGEVCTVDPGRFTVDGARVAVVVP